MKKKKAATKAGKKTGAKSAKKANTVKKSTAARRKTAAKSKTIFNAQELKVFKNKLLEVREDILNQIRDISEDTLMKSQKELSGDISGYSLHMADVATDNYEREFNFRLVSGERELLLEIDAALKRIEDKEYGSCAKCSKAIGRTRLKVIPYAKYCRKCKEEIEKTNRY